MVGIVTGNGLGLFNASQNLPGGFGSPQGGARVNVSTGNLVIQGLDRTQSGVGIDLTAVRTYNALGSVGGADGWFWDGERKVELTGTLNSSGSSVIRTGADGHETVFSWDGSAYVSSEGEGAHDSLSWDSGNSQWVWTEGNSRASDRYDSTGRLVSLTDASGNVQTFAYDGSGRLSSVTDSSGQAIVFVYDGSGRLERLDTRETTSGALTQRVYYGYDGSGRLSTVKTDLTPSDNSISDNVVYTTTYTYDSTSLRIASITQGDGTVVSFTYESVWRAFPEEGTDYRVKTVTDVTGTTTFEYVEGYLKTIVTDSLGRQWEYSFHTSGQLFFARGPNVTGGNYREAERLYDADGNLELSTERFSEKNISYEYDARGNVTLERDAFGNTIVRTWTATNQIQNEIRYTTVSTESGGVWTLPPESAALVTRYVYDGNDRLRFMVSPEGRVTEYRYEGHGLLTDEVHYTADLYVLGSLTSTDSITLSSLAAWLPITSAQLRSTFHYDYRGNLDWRKDFSAVDSSGAGIENSGMTYTRFVYDQSGLLLQTIAVTGSGRATETAQVSYGYDGAGRLQTEVSASGAKTWAYDAGAKTTTVTTSAGLTIVEAFDSSGQLISHVESATGLASRSTSYVYDAVGREVMRQDPAGIRSYTFYDEVGRVVGRVDGIGAITRYYYPYTSVDVPSAELHYGVRVDTSNWFNGTNVTVSDFYAICPPYAPQERTTSYEYDELFRLTSVVNAGIGLLTVYDDAGRILSNEQYDVVRRAQGTETASDVRRTRFFYDMDGKLIAQLDPAGYLTRHTYDAAGQLIHTLRYAGVTAAGLHSSGSLQDLEASLSNFDGLDVWRFYDAQGRQVGEVNEQQFVTRTVYDDAARTQQVTRYMSPYTGLITVGTGLDVIVSAVSGGEGYDTHIQFDLMGRVLGRTSADGTVTSYSYDGSGRLIGETAADGASDKRESLYRYDAYGQLISRLWGEGVTNLVVGMTESQVATVHLQHGESYTYDVSGRKAQSIDRAGNVTSYYYDQVGRLTHVINALGEIQESIYNTFGDELESRQYRRRITDAGVSISSLSGGQISPSLKSLIEGIRDANNDSRIQRAFDYRGRLSWVLDANGTGRTFYYYNQFDEIYRTKKHDALYGTDGRTDTFSYGKRGEVLSEVADEAYGFGIQATTQATYDAFGRIATRTNELGKVTTYTYSNSGRTVIETDWQGRTRTITHDALGRTVTVVDALGASTQYIHNDESRTTTVITPEGIATSTTLSRHGQIVAVSDGNGNVTEYAYNLNGDLLTATSADASIVTSNIYDVDGRLESTVDALGAAISYTYDAAGRVLTRTNVVTGYVTAYAFDTHGRQVSVLEGQGTARERLTEYTYDRNGNLLTEVFDPQGLALKTTYAYDFLGRNIVILRGTVADPEQAITALSYDGLDRLVSRIEDAQQVYYNGAWSNNHQYALTIETGYRYDAAGNLTRTIDANGNSNWTVYEDVGRARYSISALGDVAEYFYDENGRIVSTLSYANRVSTAGFGDVVGISSVSPVPDASRDTRSWSIRDGDGRVVAQVDALRQATVLRYDDAGNLVERKRLSAPLSANPANWETELAANPAGISTYFSYDALSRQRFEVDGNRHVTEWRYDQAGNVTDKLRYDGALPAAASWLEADITTALVGMSAVRTMFVYDSAGRLRYEAVILDGVVFGAVKARVYDVAGRETERRIFAAPVGGGAISGTAVTLSALDTAWAAAPTNEKSVSRTIMDVVGNVRFSVNSFGHVTEHRYDLLGNVVETLQYLNPVSVSGSPSIGDLATLVASANPLASDVLRSYFKRDVLGRVLYEIDPSRGVVAFVYDDAGNVVSRTRWENVMSSDPATLGAQPAYGSGMSFVSYLAYDELNRLRFEVDEGRYVTEYRYDTFGNISAKLRYDDPLPAGVTLTTTAIATAMSGASGHVTRYIHDGTGLLSYAFSIVSGVVSGLVTGYRYDAHGRVIAEYGFAAPEGVGSIAENAVTSSLLNAARDAATELRTTLTVRDAAGNARYTINSLGYVVEQRYDGLGRLAATLQYAHGINAGSVPVLDAASVGAALTLANPDAADVHHTRVINDRLGRERFVIDALGNVVEKIYDAFGNVAAQRQYAPSTPLSFGNYSESAVAAAVLGLAGTQVQTTRYAYDKSGRLRFTVDALGYLSESRYDALGRTIAQIRYGAPVSGAISSSDMVLSESELNPEVSLQAGKRETRYVYFANGDLHYTIDAMGYVTEQIRDARGLLLRESRYGTAINVSGNPAESTVSAALSGIAKRSTNYRYDAAGNAVLIFDALKYATSRIYDAHGNIVSETRHAAAISPEILEGYPLWYLQSLVDALPVAGNRTTTWEFDALGQLVTQISPAVEITIMLAGSPVVVNGVVKTRLTYDGFGNLETRSEGEVAGIRLDNGGAVNDTSSVRTAEFRYDLLGRQTVAIAPGWYDSTDRRFWREQGGQSDRFRSETTSQYDGFGNLVLRKITQGWDSNTNSVVTADTYYSYDALNRLRFEVDADGFMTESRYDGYGNHTVTKRWYYSLTGGEYPYELPAIRTEQEVLDVINEHGSFRDAPENRTLTTSYDALNRKLSVAHQSVSVYVYGGDSQTPGSGTPVVNGTTVGYATVSGGTTTGVPMTSWTYNAWGDRVKEVVAGGATTFSYFDALGRQTMTVDGGGHVTAFEYVSETANVRRQTEYATAVSLAGVTENNPPVLTTAILNDSNNRKLQHTYDDRMQLTRIDRLSATWWESNAAQTSYTQQTGTLGISQHHYNAFGEVDQATDAAGNVTSYVYDGLGHVTDMTDPTRRTSRDGGVNGIDPFWALQANGVVLFENRFSASPLTALAYNQFGQAVEQVRSAASGQAGLQQRTAMVYDAAGHVIAVEDAAGGVKEYAVDAQGRVIEETQDVHQDYSGWDGTVSLQTKRRSYTYDLRGNQVTTTDHYLEGGVEKTTTNSCRYNAFGELNWRGLEGSTIEVVSFDNAGRIIGKGAADGNTKYDYDLAGRLTRIGRYGASGTADDRFTVFVYDALGRVIEERLPHFTANTGASTDALVAQSLTDVIPLTRKEYDRWGNLTWKKDARGSIWEYTYDADNRLTSEKSPSTSAVTISNATITISELKTTRYDELGNVAVELEGKVQSGATTHLNSRMRFYNEVGQLTRDIDATGIIREYAVDAHGNQVAVKDGAGTVHYSKFDELNRVVETGLLKNAATGYGLSESLQAVGSTTNVATITGAGSTQVYPVSAPLSNGGYVVAWAVSNGTAYMAQKYTSQGVADGSPITIASGIATATGSVSVDGLPNGRFVAVWRSGSSVLAAIYSSTGSVESSFTVGVAATSANRPHVAVLSDNSFVVAWNKTAGEIYYARYSQAGSVMVSELKVNSGTNCTLSEVSALSNGGYAFAFTNNSSIRTRAYSASNVGSTEVAVSSSSISSGAGIRITGLAGDNYLVAWRRPGTQAIYARLMTNAGATSGSEMVLVASDYQTTMDANGFGLAATLDGGYALTYELRDSLYNRSYISRFDASHREVGGRISLGWDGVTSRYSTPSVTALGDGRLVAAWSAGTNPVVRLQVFSAGNEASYQDYNSSYSAADQAGLSAAGIATTVNGSAAGSQNHAQVIRLGNGGSIVAWTLDNGTGWRAQRYDSAGSAVGSVISLNVTTGTAAATANRDLSITELAGGGFVATWTNSGDIYMRRFSASGTALDATDQRVNTTQTDQGSYTQRNAVVAALQDGGFVIAWESPKSTTPRFKILFQRYNAAGTKQTPNEVLVDTAGSTASAEVPKITVLSNGNFVVSYKTTDTTSPLNARIYSSAGVLQGSTLTLASAHNSGPTELVALTGGGFVAVWRSDTAGTGLRAATFSATGTLVGTVQTVVQESVGSVIGSFGVTAIEDGGYVLAHEVLLPASGGSVIRVGGFSSGHVSTGAAQTVDSTTNTQAFDLSVATMVDGSVYVSWDRATSTSGSPGVFRRKYNVLRAVEGYENFRGNVTQVSAQSFLYDEAGQRYAEIRGSAEDIYSDDRSGNVVYSRFDERGNVVVRRDESGTERSFSYNEKNLKTQETDANERTLKWSYGSYNRLASHTDLSGRVTNYLYNNFGEIWTEETLKATLPVNPYEFSETALQTKLYDGSGTAPAIQSAVVYELPSLKVTYTYYANGLLESVYTDMGLTGPVRESGDPTDIYSTKREYDAVGNTVREINERNASSNGAGNDGTQDFRYKVDALGRISIMRSSAGTETQFRSPSSSYATPSVNSIFYYYDEFGNRRRVQASVTSNGTTQTLDDWYRYDAEGRMVVAEGALNASNVIVANKTKGTVIEYDAVGRRASEEAWKSSGSGTEIYTKKLFSYDDDGHITSSSDVTRTRATNADSSGALTVADSAPVLRLTQQYDSRGRLVSEIKYTAAGVADTNHYYSYQGDSQMVMQQDYAGATNVLKSRILYDEYDMRDDFGNQMMYRYDNYTSGAVSINYDLKYWTTFVAFDDYRQSVATVSKANAWYGDASGFGYTSFDYTMRGELVEVTSRGGQSFDRHFTSNRMGQMLVRHDVAGGNHRAQSYYYRDGESLLSAGKLEALKVADAFVSATKADLANIPTSYITQAGDTCQSIAFAIYGDNDYGYLIADANGIAGVTTALTAGTSLLIPNILTNSYNAHDTIRPYDQADIVGNTVPTPKPPPPPKEKSKTLTKIIQVVVTVVASVFLGPSIGAMVGDFAGQVSYQIANGQFDWDKALAGFVLGGLTGGAGFALGLIAGAAEDYDLERTLIAGAAGYVGGKFGAKFGAQFSSYVDVSTNVGTAMLSSAAGNVVSQGAYIALDRQDKFSWSSLALSAGAAGATAALGNFVGDYDPSFAPDFKVDSWTDVVRQAISNTVVSSAVGHVADKWFGGAEPDYAFVAFNALAGSAGALLDYRVNQSRYVPVDYVIDTDSDDFDPDAIVIEDYKPDGAAGERVPWDEQPYFKWLSSTGLKPVKVSYQEKVNPAQMDVGSADAQEVGVYYDNPDDLPIYVGHTTGDVYLEGNRIAVNDPEKGLSYDLRGHGEVLAYVMETGSVSDVEKYFTGVFGILDSGAADQDAFRAQYGAMAYGLDKYLGNRFGANPDVSWKLMQFYNGQHEGRGGLALVKDLLRKNIDTMASQSMANGEHTAAKAAGFAAWKSLIEVFAPEDALGVLMLGTGMMGARALPSARSGITFADDVAANLSALRQGAGQVFDVMRSSIRQGMASFEGRGVPSLKQLLMRRDSLARSTEPRTLSELGRDASDFRISDSMSDKSYTKLVKSIRSEGLQNPLIKYTVIDGQSYIVVGSNRFMAAKQLGKLDELRFQRVDFPVEGTNFNTAQDVLDAYSTVIRPKYRGR